VEGATPRFGRTPPVTMSHKPRERNAAAESIKWPFMQGEAATASLRLGCFQYLSLFPHLFEKGVDRYLGLMAKQVEEGVFGADGRIG
jgi:hypothetical protein